MTNLPAARGSLPVPDPAAPGTIASLPQWVETSLDALEYAATVKGGKMAMAWQIPESKCPDAATRAALHKNADALLAVVAPTPRNDADSLKATALIVMRLLKSTAGRALDDLSADALVDSYLDSLDDIPSWAVKEAVRKWNRGECGDGHDYQWRPAPAVLRKIAAAESWKIEGRALRLRALAQSIPRPEYSVDHRQEMMERLRRLFHAILGREDPIDRMRREARKESEAQLAKDRARVLAEIEAAEKGPA